jgi:hypothetical protein
MGFPEVMDDKTSGMERACMLMSSSEDPSSCNAEERINAKCWDLIPPDVWYQQLLEAVESIERSPNFSETHPEGFIQYLTFFFWSVAAGCPPTNRMVNPLFNFPV